MISLQQPLSHWPKSLKNLLSVFILVITIGVTTGLLYVNQTAGFKPEGTVEHYRGSPIDHEFAIPEKYEKSINNMLLTTHSHIVSFSIIFLIMGAILNFTSFLSPGWKNFFMIEPLISTLVTFASLWALRFIHPSFSILTLISALLMYSSFYIMAGLIIFESAFSKKHS